MKLIAFLTAIILSSQAFAERGPYFENSKNAPISHGKIVFNSFELESLGNSLFLGEVLVEKFKGGFEVGPMLYKCTMNDDDGAYGSLGCKYVRYDKMKAVSYKECDIVENEYFNCF